MRSVVIVATGTAGAQAITMAFSPVITRLYGPEAFGLLGTFTAIVTVLAPMAALTYPLAIVLPKEREDAKVLVKISILLAMLISCLAMVIILICGEQVANHLNAGEISHYLWLVPVAMLFSALHQVAEQWLIRYKQFKIIARAAVIQSSVINITKAVSGLAYPFSGVLVTIQAFVHGFWALLLWYGTKRIRNRTTTGEERKSSLQAVAQRHRDFPIFRAPEVTINAASQSMPVLMLAAFFGPTSAGFYTLGRTVMGIPAGLIGKSVGDVFYPRISEAANSGERLYPLVKKATLLLGAVGILPFAIVVAFGPLLFSFVFGADWTVAGEYARWLAVWMFFTFANNPSVKAIPIVNAQAFHLLYTMNTILLRIGGLAFAYYVFETDVASVIAFSVVGALVNIVLIAVIFNKCKKFDRSRA